MASSGMRPGVGGIRTWSLLVEGDGGPLRVVAGANVHDTKR